MSKRVVLKEVVCSFPHVFKPNTKFGPDGKREITILLHKENNKSDIEVINRHIDSLRSRCSKPIYADKICLKDGDTSGRTEYFNHYVIKGASSKVIPVVDTRKNQLDEFTCDIQGGDIVNVVFNLWLQDNAYGQRVNCALEAVQYVSRGAAFTSNAVDAFDVFDINFENSEEF